MTTIKELLNEFPHAASMAADIGFMAGMPVREGFPRIAAEYEDLLALALEVVKADSDNRDDAIAALEAYLR